MVYYCVTHIREKMESYDQPVHTPIVFKIGCPIWAPWAKKRLPAPIAKVGASITKAVVPISVDFGASYCWYLTLRLQILRFYSFLSQKITPGSGYRISRTIRWGCLVWMGDRVTLRSQLQMVRLCQGMSSCKNHGHAGTCWKDGCVSSRILAWHRWHPDEWYMGVS